MNTNHRIAAIGTDGTRPVVWGMGATEDAAEAEAARWLAEAESSVERERLVYCEITAEDAARVTAGDVDATAILERNPQALARLQAR